ncbi:regulatory protein npr5 [Phtheirospermum japonicum]|uniref:Regulatory protein npr5 n=1 Tax=Phtheirospermum japonicum TaxID=374723 RepID=A0A830BPR1_9LAMI|nr:regulatory protein npr5 [Phtheirospermum japonicum]
MGPLRGPVSQVIPVNTVGYEVFLLMLQFLYCGNVSVVPQKLEPRANCGERGCCHAYCAATVNLALDNLAAARSFGVELLALITVCFFPCFLISNLSHFLLIYFYDLN